MLCVNTWQETPRQIRKGLNQNIPDIFMQIQLSGYLGRFNNVAKGNSCLFPGHNQFKRFSSILKQKPRKDSYLNKVLNQTTSACTV